MNEEFKNKFKELNSIVKELKERKVKLALVWAKSKEKELENIGSDLLFNLHYTEFSGMLNQ
jgi:hypothetical protein